MAVDSDDRVYVLVRANPPIRVYDRDGHPLSAWGEGLLRRPHGISVTRDGRVYVVDDWGHTVHRFSPAAELELTLTRRGEASDYDSLADPDRPESVTRVSPPFNYPTHAVETASGEIYVTDGYGNARVHVFSGSGELKTSWGAPGSGPGEFRIPHGIACAEDGALYVADRLNSRVQIFSPDGRVVGQWAARWPNNVAFDQEGSAYVAELGSIFLFTQTADLAADRPRITVRSPDGEVQAEITPLAEGEDDLYFSPHGIAVDSRGDLYVSEVPASYCRGHAPKDWSVLRKYVRL